jgi:glycosyltransferase involved in cell wall biosynthesis
MIVSIITVVFNCKEFIGGCLHSVYSQTYANIEHIIIDGGSTDGTLRVIRKQSLPATILISENDQGYYDALNKGIKISKGNVIGILNADDEFSTKHIVENVVQSFKAELCDAVYGNVNFVKRSSTHLIHRKWRDRIYNRKDFLWGWMPAHTSLFLNRNLFSRYGYYSLDFGSCADYDLTIRFLHLNHAKAFYRNEVFVSMRAGGMSNGSFKKLYLGLKNDYRILKSNNFRFCWRVVIFKRLRKLQQFVIYV